MNTYSINSNSSTNTLHTFQSDEIGNITNVSGANLNWNGRRLESISAGGTDLISYKYNIDGQRISKTYDGVTTEYFYNGDILAGQKKGDDVIVFMYDNNGDIFGFTYNGTPYYYVKNAQNDVVMVLNCNDRTAVVYQYDAWGNITDVYDSTTQRVSNINPITYRSYYYDIEMGVYYLNSRYYVPIICRFLSADSYVQTGQGVLSNNMFAYCMNNPVNMGDSTGTWPKWLSGALNIVSGVTQMALGSALGAFTSWTGVGAVAAGFLMINGAATVAQGIGQIVNDVSKSNVLREDNIVRTSVKNIGGTIGGDTGAKIAGGIYDVAVIAANLYAGKVNLEQSMPKIVKSKIFSANDGYGFKVGKNIEMFYRNPNAAGGLGGTIFSYKGPLRKFRIDWDPTFGFHCHPPGH